MSTLLTTWQLTLTPLCALETTHLHNHACLFRKFAQNTTRQQELTALQRLVRFLARDGRTYYGDAILPRGVSDISKARQARVVQGDIFGKHQVTDHVADIRMLLAPLAPEDVRTVRCLGLNYAAHAKEVCTASLSFGTYIKTDHDKSPKCPSRSTPSSS